MNKKTTTPLAVIAGARTPMTKAFTELRDASAVELGRTAVTDCLRRGGLEANQIDQVVMGNVSGPADSANPARVISLMAGIPIDRVAHTVNRNCASGMEAIIGAGDAITSGRADLVIAGGTESMSNIPLLYNREAAGLWMQLAKAKSVAQRLKVLGRFRPRHFKPVVGIELGLTDPVSGLNMGQTAELLAKDFAITREDQDQFAMRSHHKAEAAQTRCFLSGEIAPVAVDGGDPIEKDNGIRYDQSMQQLAKLRPMFGRDGEGTVTAGNSCPLTDGAAALLLADHRSADRFDSPPLGYVTAIAVAGCDPSRMGLGPVFATAKLLEQTGLSMPDFDLIELNEAFAAQVIACEKAFASKSFASEHLSRASALGEIDPDRLNINGGAIALGHPVGMTGARLVLTCLRALRETGKKRGLATLCVGGGQGVAMVVETELE